VKKRNTRIMAANAVKHDAVITAEVFIP
jgi:hypothetical protein